MTSSATGTQIDSETGHAKATNPSDSATTLRRVVALVRGLAGFTVLGALIFQIVEKTVNNDMIPDQYFMFFTVQGAIITIAVLFWAGHVSWRRLMDPRSLTIARLAVLSYAVVTAVVYNVLLRGIPDEGFVTTPWPGEILHVWIPIFVVLDWLLAPGRPAVRWKALGIVVIYPLAWVGVTIVRGIVTDWYPYPFLNPETGWGSVGVYIVAIAAFIIAIASLGIAVAQRSGRTAS
ncbi:MAG: Pr6Pr family membrane protein [Microbacteriaceae bacterium]